MVKERLVVDVFGIGMWIGCTSGGWGNGPYREEVKIGAVKPDDEVISHASGWRESDVVLIWRSARIRDLNTRSRVRKLFPFSFRRCKQVDYIIREFNLPLELSGNSENFRKNYKSWIVRKALQQKLSENGITIPDSF